MNGRPHDVPPTADPPGMEIPLGRGRRWTGLAGWLVAVAGVAAALVWLFVQFTASLWVALLLVVFMLAYMAVMSWVVLRKSDEGQ